MIGTLKEVLPRRLTAPILVTQLVTTLYNLIRLDSEGGSCVFHNTTPQYSSTSGKKKELIHDIMMYLDNLTCPELHCVCWDRVVS